jgi:mannose/cellobiose epimerase-like protein (N-acyl-D-glucosamine 2-epimerase family)
MIKPSIGEQAWDALHRHVLVPLVPRCMDQEYGGFLVDFDDRWNPVGLQDKSLEHAARTTMAFAQIDRAMPGKGYERFVRHGCAFLQQAMWDGANGGFFARVDRSGRPQWEALKHPHAVTYAGLAFLLAEPHLPPGEGLMWAERALNWLDEFAWDPVHGGYWGSFRRDNDRYRDGSRLPTPDGKDIFGLTSGFKEINTQGDAIVLLTSFAKRLPDVRYAERLAAMVDLVANRLMQPNGVLPYRYLPDWRPAPDLARIGYQFMMAHHFAVAATVARFAGAVTRARELVDFCFPLARHPAGGFCFAVAADGRGWPTSGPSSELRQWWVQLEAVHTLHVLANNLSLDGAVRAQYREARDEQWSFVCNSLFDERYGGIRELPCEPGGRWLERPLALLSSRARALKSHCWKDCSHEVATFLALATDQSLPPGG